MAGSPSVMVSSTFYDLKQVRADLSEFLIEGLGYRALLSEHASFPVDPDVDTFENCRRRVENEADMLVLVVGGRYGSIDDRSAKSITNLEYMAARSKGIPIYVFVDARILTILPTWVRNPSGDFSDVVDTPKLFAFVQEIREQQKSWVFPFEMAQDIVSTLKAQFAHQFLEGLRLAAKVRGVGTPAYLSGASPQVHRLILDRPSAWEYRLFFQGLLDEVNRLSWALRDHRSAIQLGIAEDVPAADAVSWLLTRSHELQGAVDSLNHLVNTEAPIGFGAPGEPGDPDYILWTTRKIGDVLEAALDWSHRVRRARVGEPFNEAAAEMSKWPNDFIEEIVAFPAAKLDEIEESLRSASVDNPVRLEWTLRIALSNGEAFEEALERARLFYQG